MISSIIELKKTKNIDYSKLSDLYYFEPGGTSIRNIRHWLQILSTHETSTYDLNEDSRPYNLDKLSDIKFDSLFFYGNEDPYIPPKSIEYMRKLISNAEYSEIDNYNHLDYLWSLKSKELIYNKIISFLK